MRRFRGAVALAAAALTVGGAAIASSPSAGAAAFSVRRVCAAPTAGHAACFALEARGAQHLSAEAGPAGYHPADLLDAYKLNAKKGKNHTIAIIDAFDNPNAEADLAVYRSTFGLKPCTTANGCFRKVNQTGGTTAPASDVNWGEEIALDLDMASAICPNCKLLLVEATTNSYANLAAAVNEAVVLGATEISNSYGGNENATPLGFASSYNHPGIPITVSSGDLAYAAGPQMPAAFSTVTAVGGTNLKKAAASTRGWSESVWFTPGNGHGAGSGCSTLVAKPAFQKDTACPGRTIADVSAVADPATGVSVYDTFGVGGWLVFGGTSASAPIVAGVYALAGNGASIKNASRAYKHTANLFDVTKGNNGTCGGSLLCKAKKGYDGPTGLGTPNGSAAF